MRKVSSSGDKQPYVGAPATRWRQRAPGSLTHPPRSLVTSAISRQAEATSEPLSGTSSMSMRLISQ